MEVDEGKAEEEEVDEGKAEEQVEEFVSTFYYQDKIILQSFFQQERVQLEVVLEEVVGRVEGSK